MDEQSIHGDQEPFERSCKQALGFDNRNVENDDPVVEAVNIHVYYIQSAYNSSCGCQTFSEDANSSKKIGLSSMPWKALQTKGFPYFFHHQSIKCCFTVISSISDPNYTTSVRCRCITEDLRGIRDIIIAKIFSSFKKGITSLSRHTIDDFRRSRHKL